MTSPYESGLGGKFSCPEKWYGVSSRESRSLILDLTSWKPCCNCVFHLIALDFGKHAISSMGRPLSKMTRLRISIVEVKVEENCRAHALIIANAKVDNDAKYKSYRQGRKIISVWLTVRGFPNSSVSKNISLNTVYQGLSCDDNVRRLIRRFQAYQLNLCWWRKALSCDLKRNGCYGKKVRL